MSDKVDLWAIEHECFESGCQLICGVDEAGRGPLAGPVCAAAVILPPDMEIPGLNDSKKLTDKKRRELFDVITSEAVAFGIEQFNGTPYEQHYIFVKNTFEYYQLIKTFFTEPILTRIVSDREITLQEKCEFKKKTGEIESKGKQIVNMASFGG